MSQCQVRSSGSLAVRASKWSKDSFIPQPSQPVNLAREGGEPAIFRRHDSWRQAKLLEVYGQQCGRTHRTSRPGSDLSKVHISSTQQAF